MKKLILMLMLIAPLSVFAQKFGHINSQEIMAQMPEFIKARGRKPDMSAQDPWEALIAEGARAFVKYKQEGAYDAKGQE